MTLRRGRGVLRRTRGSLRRGPFPFGSCRAHFGEGGGVFPLLADHAGGKQPRKAQKGEYALGVQRHGEREAQPRSEHIAGACRGLCGGDAPAEEAEHAPIGGDDAQGDGRVRQPQPPHGERQPAERRQRRRQKSPAGAAKQLFAEKVQHSDQPRRAQEGHDAQPEGAHAEDEGAEHGQKRRQRAEIGGGIIRSVGDDAAEADIIHLQEGVFFLLRELRIGGIPRSGGSSVRQSRGLAQSAVGGRAVVGAEQVSVRGPVGRAEEAAHVCLCRVGGDDLPLRIHERDAVEQHVARGGDADEAVGRVADGVFGIVERLHPAVVGAERGRICGRSLFLFRIFGGRLIDVGEGDLAHARRAELAVGIAARGVAVAEF